MMEADVQVLPETRQDMLSFELSFLPREWRLAKLRHAFNFNKGLTITKENLQDEGIPCVNYGEVHSKYGFEVDPARHPLKCVDVSYIEDNPASLLKRGDFVFADTSEDIEGSGNFTCYNSDLQAFAGYHTLIAKPKVPMNARFMAYLIDSQTFRAQVQIEVKGVKVFSITQAILKPTVVWFPPPHAQDAIAAFLDDKCAKIDGAVKIKEDQIALLRERRQIIIQDAVTRGLNPAAPMKDSGIDWISQIPAHWDVVRFKYLFTQSRLPVQDDDEIVTSYRDGQVTLRSNRRLDGYTEAIIEGGYQGIRPGQLVLNSMDAFEGAIGVSDSAGKCTPEYVICNPNNSKINQNYFSYLLREMALAKYIQVICNAVRQRAVRIRFNNLATRFLAVPPLDEQKEIVDFIDAQKMKIAEAIAIKERQIAALKEYKTSLINAAVTGKIKVS
ncbi:restriction endonuclease subunit S [Aestuariivirga sp.]|uniref:restriction endonuclease subunit S n=1 Tax=Aestuariivirga sp. TaxID=2650926 RepID=UPI00359427D5